MVGSDLDEVLENAVCATLPLPSAIDYYGKLQPNDSKPIRTGEPVIFGLRAQAFVTRAFVVSVSEVCGR